MMNERQNQWGNKAPSYRVGKSLTKAGTPLALVVVVNALVMIAKSNGVEIDEAAALSIAVAGYGVVMGVGNWLKNRKKGK